MLKALLEETLEKYRTGQVQWTVANQFDEALLESALENFTEEKAAQYLEGYPANRPVRPLALATFLSEFEVPELDPVWTR